MLTAKQEAFAQGVANGLTVSDAYRKAYNSEGTSKTINEMGSKQLANPKIRARVDELKSKLVAKALWTREKSVQALAAIAEGADKPAEIVAAVKELNAMHGFNAPSKMEIEARVARVNVNFD